MSELEIIKEIDLDFYNKKTVFVDAKQNDRKSRYILVNCYNHGSFVALESQNNRAFIRFKKKDECIAFNQCEITKDGKVMVELTQNMLAFPGNCIADLLVMKISKENENNSESSTMQFFVNVIAMPYDNSEIESTDEFNALSDLMDKALKDYTYVMEHAQESADKAEEEATKATDAADKAKESQSEAANSANASAQSATAAATSAAKSAESAAEALNSQNAAKDSEIDALNSANAAKTSETNANKSEAAAKTSEENADKYATNAENSATAAATSAAKSAESAENAAISEANANEYANAAAVSEQNASKSEENARQSELNAKKSENVSSEKALSAETYATTAAESAESANVSADLAAQKAEETSENAAEVAANTEIATQKAKEAEDSALMAKSYTEGNTNLRPDENVDNAKFYYEQSKSISESFSGALRPMGTVSFNDLILLKSAVAGDMYNINTDFTTTTDFREGVGYSYPSGTNVYRTADNKWDCLAGTPVTSVNGERGNVVITKDTIGLDNVNNTADANKNVNSAKTADKLKNALTFAGNISETFDGSTPKTVRVQSPTGNTGNNVVNFTSGDDLAPSDWTNVELIKTGETHNSLFNKISTMCRNVRWLFSKLGTTELSGIGDGTVTGAISALNSRNMHFYSYALSGTHVEDIVGLIQECLTKMLSKAALVKRNHNFSLYITAGQVYGCFGYITGDCKYGATFAMGYTFFYYFTLANGVWVRTSSYFPQ